MKLAPLKEGLFLRRLNRFAALVQIGGREALVHVANSGRMRELFQPGNRCFLAPMARPGRKTDYDLALVEVLQDVVKDATGQGRSHSSKKWVQGAPCLVSADARLPSLLVWEAFLEGRLAPFAGCTGGRREVVFQDSRLDLLLHGSQQECLVEVKSVTLVEGGVGLFPDAPTERGRRHVQALTRAVGQGYRGAAVFVIQRDDAEACVPNDAADPAFGAALREAVAAGVEAYAYTCSVTRREVRLLDQVPVRL